MTGQKPNKWLRFFAFEEPLDGHNVWRFFANMPWSTKNPPSVAKNWTASEKKKCVEAANAVLRDGGSEGDAIRACIHNAGKSKKKQESVDMPTELGAKENAAQQTRSKRYNIPIREDGNVTKPGKWSHLSDSQFGDPVNYLYPVPDKQHAISAKSYFAQHADKYSSGRSVVKSRINRLCRKYGVDPIAESPEEGKKMGNFLVGEIKLESESEVPLEEGMVFIPAAREATMEHPWWGTLYLDTDLFESFVDNWETNVVGHELAIDPSHDPGQGALAWVKGLEISQGQDGKPSLGIYAQKTSAGNVLGDVFKYCSIEYTENYVDRETGVSYGPTLLGAAATNRPFVNRQNAMTVLNMPPESVEDSHNVHFIYLSQPITRADKEVDSMTIEVEGNVGTGVTLEDGTEVVDLNAIPDPQPETQPPDSAPVTEPTETLSVAPTLTSTASVTPDTGLVIAEVQSDGISLTADEVKALISRNLQLAQRVKEGMIRDVCDKAMARGVPPVVLDAARQILNGLEPDAQPTLSLSEPGEAAKQVNLFNAVAMLVDAVPGRAGEFTLTDSGEKPPAERKSENPYELSASSTEEAEQKARDRRKALGIASDTQENVSL